MYSLRSCTKADLKEGRKCFIQRHTQHILLIVIWKEGNVLFNDALNTFLFTVIWKVGNVLFNDALNTFYLWLYGIRHLVKDHSDSERGNPLLPHGLLFPIRSKGSLYSSSRRQDNTYHSLCYTSCGALAGTRNSSMGPPWRIDLTTHRTMSERSYHGATSRSLQLTWR